MCPCRREGGRRRGERREERREERGEREREREGERRGGGGGGSARMCICFCVLASQHATLSSLATTAQNTAILPCYLKPGYRVDHPRPAIVLLHETLDVSLQRLLTGAMVAVIYYPLI